MGPTGFENVYKSLKTPVSIVFQKSVDNFMGTKVYFLPL